MNAGHDLPGRCPQQHPATDQGRAQIITVGPRLGLTRAHRLDHQCLTQCCPGVVAVPAGQLHHLIQDPDPTRPVSTPVGQGLLPRDSLPLIHRQLYPR